MARVDKKTCDYVTNKLRQYRLSRYPRPQRIVHNGGGEFTHHEYKNVLRVLLYSNPPKYMTQARDIIDDALATAMNVMRIVVATSLGITPGALVFSRDMLLNVSTACC